MPSLAMMFSRWRSTVFGHHQHLGDLLAVVRLATSLTTLELSRLERLVANRLPGGGSLEIVAHDPRAPPAGTEAARRARPRGTRRPAPRRRGLEHEPEAPA